LPERLTSIRSILIGDSELQVRPRDFQNDILAVFDEGHPPIRVSVWPTDGSEFNIDLEIRTVPTDKRPLQRCEQSTFSGENGEQSPSGHTELDRLHSLQSLGNPNRVILSGLLSALSAAA
jgi:hypothetical protein